MDAAEPRVRRRGFVVIHTDPGLDLEDESDSAEGVTVRLRITRPKAQRHISATSSRTSATIARRDSSRHSTSTSSDTSASDHQPVKSVTATGIRQRSHSPR
jgi:hypothetical protein